MQEVLTGPLSEKEIRRQMEAAGRIEGTVAVDIEDVIEGDRESFLTLLSELLTDSAELEDIEYELVGHENGMAHFHVNGDASIVLEDLGAEELEDEEEEEEDYE